VRKTRVGVLISGRGSNLQALIEACKTPAYPAEIVLVVSNVPNVQGLAHAEDAAIAAQGNWVCRAPLLPFAYSARGPGCGRCFVFPRRKSNGTGIRFPNTAGSISEAARGTTE
jgi:hypothetical protein